jgi:DNA polymerase elongation subunit (family B)
MSESNVLVLDIETQPIVAYVWNLKEQFVALNQIKEDWQIMAWSAKWLNSDLVVYHDKRNDKNDKRILKVLWDFLDKADIVVTQNGQSFDIPKINARFILHGMKPPSPVKHLDTYRIAKKVFEFTSNKLEYLTDKLCTKYKKLSHKKFRGMSLWTECLAGNRKAWDAMKEYNIHDVLSTEELYNKLKAWTPQSMPSVYNNGTCPVCGEAKLQKRGTERKAKLVYQRLHCQACGKWTLGGKIG